jgi:50S ribosomal protein L16 3-hydroxylase
VDSYDVFLVQGAGRRRWRVCRPRKFRLVPGAPLKLIDGFRAEHEYVLDPGDLLYLPPGWGHDGVALDECFTASVGFRAPRGAELAAAFLDYLHERGLPDAAYRDPGLKVAKHPAAIGGDMTAFAAKLLSRISWRKGDVDDFLGRYLSTPKPNVAFTAGAGARSIQGATVRLDPRTQMLHAGARFFVNGERYTPRARQRPALAELADRRLASGGRLAAAGLEPQVLEWQRAGWLHLEDA